MQIFIYWVNPTAKFPMFRENERAFHIHEWATSLHAKIDLINPGIVYVEWWCIWNIHDSVFPVSLSEFTARPSGTQPAWEKNTSTELHIGSYVHNHLVSNHCHLKRKWLYNMWFLKQRWDGEGGQVMVK